MQLFLTVIVLASLSEYCLKQIYQQSSPMNKSHTGVLSDLKPDSKVTEMLVHISLQIMLLSWMKEGMNEWRKTGRMQMKWHHPISLIDFRLSCALPRLLPWDAYTETQKFTVREQEKWIIKFCQELLEPNLLLGDLG